MLHILLTVVLDSLFTASFISWDISYNHISLQHTLEQDMICSFHQYSYSSIILLELSYVEHFRQVYDILLVFC